MKQLCSLLFILFFSGNALAETRWINDKVLVPLRTGMGSGYRIIDRGLPSGTRLEVLESASASGEKWAKVRTPSGKVGYLPAQYLSSSPTAALLLEDMQKKIQRLEVENKELKSQNKSLSQESGQHSQLLIESQSERSALQQELAELQRISGSAVAMHENHRKLMHDHQLLQTELDVVKSDNQRLKSQNSNRQMLTGGGLVLLGVLIALLAPRFRPKKSYSEWA